MPGISTLSNTLLIIRVERYKQMAITKAMDGKTGNPEEED
jgi:hypothetical protein